MIKKTLNNSVKNSTADQNSRSYNSAKEDEKESILRDLNYPASKQQVPKTPVLTQQRLQEAIIWSEILGEPKCRRRKRR